MSGRFASNMVAPRQRAMFVFGEIKNPRWKIQHESESCDRHKPSHDVG
jgi:hypothetical protein